MADPDGVLLVDKPQGRTSFDAIAQLRRRLRVKKVGHAGTLDPMATGLLIVLVGEATKLTPWTMGLDKEYEATVRFGAATDTEDATGRVVATAEPERLERLDEAAVRAALPRFVGRIRQRPPVYSALKRNGERLYDLARRAAEQGDDASAIEVEEREITVHAVELLGFERPEARLRVRCGKGTYIRSLARDLGEALGVPAHLAALRRTRIGSFRVEEARDPFDLKTDPELAPLERAVAHLPAVVAAPAAEESLRAGRQQVLAELLPERPDELPVRLVDAAGRLIAIAEAGRGGRPRLARVFAPARSNDAANR